MSELVPEIRVSLNGPYLVSNVVEFRNWLGGELQSQSEMALCRCGQSSNKPFCDGTHVQTNFSGDKDPNRVPDERDAYEGQQIEIFDNRGICAHSGFCTDRLASVFHVKQEPFITPSGGRLDEIFQAVRACPSGALSYGIDGVEARNQVDPPRPPSVEVSRDGPYRVTGGVRLVDEHGNDVPRAKGSSREHFSLCRCGHSQNRPFCSGIHWYVKFADPVPSPEHKPTLFEWAGGFPALLRMTRIFYTKYVPQDPLVGPLFANMSPDHPERVAAWLSEVFGGPKFYSERRRLLAHDLPARRQVHHRGAASALGKNALSECRRRYAAERCGVSGGVCCVPRMGFAHRPGKLSEECDAPAQYAGATLVVGLRSNAGFKSLSLGPAGGCTTIHRNPRSRRVCDFCPAHQAAIPENGSGIDELRIRSMVAQRCAHPRIRNSQAP